MRSLNSRKTASKSHAAQHSSNIERLEARRLLSTVVVNTTADSTDAKGSSTVSLRDAIAVANAATSPTTITFSPTVFATAKTITLNPTTLVFSNTAKATTITGPSALVTVDGVNKISSGNGISINAGVSVSISNLTLTRAAFNNNGTLTLTSVTVSNEIFTSSGIGGGIANENGGTLTAANCTITGNKIESGNGGGLWNAGKATLTSVGITGNAASSFGGGIYNSGTLTVTATTISGNSTTGDDDGGGIYNIGTLMLTDVTLANNPAGGAIDNAGGSTTMDDSTVSGNHANLNGGGIYNTATFKIGNSIVAGNSAGTAGPDVHGAFTSAGHNLIGKTDTGTGWVSSDFTGTAAKPLAAGLGTLANNGGPTLTMLPLIGSPAIDKGSNSLIPSGVTTDQRGLPRTFNTTVDIGAVEVQPLIQIKAPGNQTATVGVSKSVTLGTFTQYTNAGPYKDLITWGDGSATTTLSLTAAGTIPATAHAFAKSGTITVTEIITDAKGNKSNKVTFTDVVTGGVGSIAGTVYNDANGDGKIDDGEIGVGGWTVYLDLNKDGTFDTGDKSIVTSVNGTFSFTGLTAGTYLVRVVPVTGVAASKPTGNLLTITLAAGQNSVGNLFGEKAA